MWTTLFFLALATQGILGATDFSELEDDEIPDDFPEERHDYHPQHIKYNTKPSSAKGELNVLMTLNKMIRVLKKMIQLLSKVKHLKHTVQTLDAKMMKLFHQAKQLFALAATGKGNLAKSGLKNLLKSRSTRKKPSSQKARKAKPTSASTGPSTTGTGRPSYGRHGLTVVVLVKLKGRWKNVFKNMYNRRTILLKKRLCKSLKAQVRSSVGQLKCKCFKLSPGSIVGHVALTVSSKAKKKELIRLIKLMSSIATRNKLLWVRGLPVKSIKIIKGGMPSKPSKPLTCRPCGNLPKGIRIIKQSSCPTNLCATLQINPMQLAAPAAAQSSSYSTPVTSSVTSYQSPYQASATSYQSPYSACPSQCQQSSYQYSSCPSSCPVACCSQGKK